LIVTEDYYLYRGCLAVKKQEKQLKESKQILQVLKAKALKTPYKIKQEKSINTGKKKPSDYFGTLSKEDGERMLHYVNESRTNGTEIPDRY